MRCLSILSRVVISSLAVAASGCPRPAWEDPVKSREEILAGFVVKVGYLLSAWGAAHSALLSLGYTLSF